MNSSNFLLSALWQMMIILGVICVIVLIVIIGKNIYFATAYTFVLSS